jgi:regulator of protease activity HflC (stomatin/prohibitin superfamily)
VQGQLTYRVSAPKRLAELLDFSIRPDGSYASDDPESLTQRLVSITQIHTRNVVSRLPLRQVLASAEAMVTHVLTALRSSEEVAMLGAQVLALAVQSVKPTPEMAKALEADAREALQRVADEAIYARRNAAVEQERKIKESELNTELAVEAKRRQIRESQMAASPTREYGYTEMKGSWFVFDQIRAHPDHCRWRAPFWHGSRVLNPNSHRNYHLGFRCCKSRPRAASSPWVR